MAVMARNGRTGETAPMEDTGGDGDALAMLAAALKARGRDEAVLARARRAAAASGERLVKVLLKLGLVGERELAEALAEALELPLVTADGFPETPLFEDRVSPRFLAEEGLLPVREEEGRVVVAAVDPTAHEALDALALALGRPVAPAVAPHSEIEAAIARLYAAGSQLETEAALEEEMDGGDALATDIERLRDLASEAPVIRTVNRLIAEAAELGASDIHLEPREYGLGVRYRIDGVLQEQPAPPAQLATAIVSRIKIMARLDIAERRLPQDGRIKIVVKGAPIDLRVSTLPGIHGEGVVLRLLDREQVALEFAALGITDATRRRFLDILDRPNGIFLVTGPTGSGKTTTLYAALQQLNDASRKIITVEDPVEYQIEGISQTAVRPEVGLTFAAALRAILRHDPDIILVGEIRDVETAEIAAQAALTGHLVLSTLHTNDAPSSLTRLLDMGLPEYLVSATLNGAAAQRLVRRLCPDCSEPRIIAPEFLARLGVADPEAWLEAADPRRAVGCAQCHQTGYRGRTAIMEILEMTDAIRRLLVAHADSREIRAQAIRDGMRPLVLDGLEKVRTGVTSLEEVLRVAHGGMLAAQTT
ncbi:MAG: type II secretion system protein GspE [Rhodothalassiaceae bacterium]|nr:MAG: type II secretion system protein GspE [Rhodothalassiaceae bacterium]